MLKKLFCAALLGRRHRRGARGGARAADHRLPPGGPVDVGRVLAEQLGKNSSSR